MANHIVGLKYRLPYRQVDTEEKLLEVFGQLKESYEGFSRFRITDRSGREITGFRQFLETAIGEGAVVVLHGSGDIGGLVVKNASVEYDLSSVHNVVKYWDQYCNGTCHSCRSIERDLVEQEWRCGDGVEPMKWKGCKDYNPLLTGRGGKRAARTLATLVREAL